MQIVVLKVGNELRHVLILFINNSNNKLTGLCTLSYFVCDLCF